MPSPVICERFGRYVLLHRFAVGGMAEIFLARAPGGRGKGQLLVIKRMREELVRDRAFVDIFVDEQRAIARLDHPNIVRVYDCGEIDGRYYLALEHVWGESLATLISLCSKAKMRFPLRAALHIGIAVAEALQHAHSHVGADGRRSPIVHRDVTLGNVVISFQGAIKVLDFGLAKFADRQARTGIGQIKGTLVYLAPEQVTGAEVEPATDIYQLGVLLYKSLVGCEPIAGANEMAMTQAIARGEVIKPTTVMPNFPPRLEAVLLKAMARQPIARFASAGEFAAALRDLLVPPDPNATERLAKMVERVTGDRYERQLAFVRSLLQGAAAVAPVEDIWRLHQAPVEPKTIEVELSAIIGEEEIRELRATIAPDDPRSLIVEFSGLFPTVPEAVARFERAPTLVDENAVEPEAAIVSEVFASLPRTELEPNALAALDNGVTTKVAPLVASPLAAPVAGPVEPAIDGVFDDESSAFAPMPRFDPAAPTRVVGQPLRLAPAALPVALPLAADVDNVPTSVSAPAFLEDASFDVAPTDTPDETFATVDQSRTAVGVARPQTVATAVAAIAVAATTLPVPGAAGLDFDIDVVDDDEEK